MSVGLSCKVWAFLIHSLMFVRWCSVFVCKAKWQYKWFSWYNSPYHSGAWRRGVCVCVGGGGGDIPRELCMLNHEAQSHLKYINLHIFQKKKKFPFQPCKFRFEGESGSKHEMFQNQKTNICGTFMSDILYLMIMIFFKNYLKFVWKIETYLYRNQNNFHLVPLHDSKNYLV